jgi:hypothetical protein
MLACTQVVSTVDRPLQLMQQGTLPQPVCVAGLLHAGGVPYIVPT